MKVKKDACMRSLTALLRPLKLKNSSDSNEECEPWYTTVPSITYIWTHRPQWRRRHKNRKKVKTIPVTFINSGAKEDKNRYFWETLRPQERPCSRSSTSPYETCSSRQIFTESELMRNCGSQRNREVLMSKKKSHSANRKVLVCETHSDSGLRNFRSTKLLGLIRSQKRLGVGNSANSQNTIGTLSSLEVNRSGQLLVCKALQSDNSIPKRRVTFSNYVSENSVTDTRSQISSIIMNDNETSDTSWCQRSYVRLTDDEDNCSMQTDLSCLISSIIFDESKSSFFSLTSGISSEKQKKSHTDSNSEFNDTFFYVNSSYSNGSSCNLLSLSNNFSSDDFQNTNGSSLVQRNFSNVSDFGNKTLIEKLSQLSVSKEVIPLSKTPDNLITTEPTYKSTSCIVDVVTNELEEKLSQLNLSNEIEPVFKINDDLTTDTMYTRTKRGNNFVKHHLRENPIEINKIVTGTRIAEEITTKLTPNRTPRIVDAIKNKLEENLSQLRQSSKMIPVVKTPEDITSRSMYSHTLCIVDAMKKKLVEKLSQSNFMESGFKTPENIITESMSNHIPCADNFGHNKWRENLIQSNQIVFDIKKAEETKIQHTYSGTSYTVDVLNKKLPESLSQSGRLNNISPVFQTSEDVPIKSMYTRIPRSDDFAMNQWRENLMESNKIVSDTKKAEETRIELMHSRSSYTDYVMMKNVEEKLSPSNLSNEIVPFSKKPEDIISETIYCRTRRTDDFVENQFKENRIESKEIIPVFKKPEHIISDPMYCRTRRTDDFVENQWKENRIESNEIVQDVEIPGKIKTDPTNNNMECITIELKDISSTVKEVLIESRIESHNEGYATMQKNHISTDTSDLIAFNLIPLLNPKTQLLNNAADNGILNIREIFNFLQQPPESLDASLLFQELATVVQQPFSNCDPINKLGNVNRKKSKESTKEIEDQAKVFRIDTETCGEYESLFIEMKDFRDDFEKNEVLEKKNSLQFRNCCEESCDNESALVTNLNGSGKYSEIVESTTSHFHNEYTKCSAEGKCCLVCGRRGMDNSRYIRPVCRVKGGTWSPHSEKDPWINVIKKVVKYDNHKELVPQKSTIPKNEEILKDQELTEELSKKSASNTNQNILNETPTEYEKKSKNIIKNEDEEEKCLSVIITQADDPLLPISPVDTNVKIPSSRTDRSTSCCPPELHASTSFGFATFRGPRTQSAKTYFMRESVRTVQGTANRLLCVISESDSLMAVPPFLPKKPPNWFARQMPTRRCLRR